MNKSQLTELVIIPTLEEIPKGYSLESILAAQMIIAHESSGGEYIAQVGGPALGIIQMEPATHDDVWKHGDSIWDNAVELEIITIYQSNNKQHPSAKRLIYDLRYNIFMLRQKLFMDPDALPSNVEDMAVYLKKYWNGGDRMDGGGKATVTKYHNDFINWK